MVRLKSFLGKLFVICAVGLMAFMFLDGMGPGNPIDNLLGLVKTMVWIPISLLVLAAVLLLWFGGVLFFGISIYLVLAKLAKVIRHHPKAQ